MKLVPGSLLPLLLLSVQALAQDVISELRPERAYVGQEVRYYVQVQGATEARCELEAVEGLSFRLEDEGVTNQSTQITIINGRRAVRETADYTFVYRVLAARPGRYRIPPARVTVKGRLLRGERLTLVIDDPAKEDRAALELRCEPPRVVLGQDAKLIVDVYLKHLPPELRARDPLELYDQSKPFSFFDRGTPPPALALPWLSEPPQGLGPIDLEQWVRSRQVRRGFRLTGVRGGRFLEAKQAVDVERADSQGRSIRYRRYRFSLDIRGEVAGTYRFPPAVLQGQLVASQGRRFVWREAFTRSLPLELEVLEPPLEGRPATFSGAVGVFSFSMEPPTPTLVRVGDPVYVTLVASGRGFLKGVGLDLGAQLGERFRVERVGVTDALPPGAERPPGFPDRPGQWRQWDFKVYPISAELEAIPAVAFSWFDPERSAYATESTEPVPITVRSAAEARSDIVVAGDPNDTPREVELVPTTALSANVRDLNLLANHAPRPWLPLACLLALPVVYALLSFFVRRARRLRDDP
ncbi:MAG: BatD family protein, partial [Planctomycetota bacterium]